MAIPQLRATVEEVPIETIQIGDFVFLEVDGARDRPRCVLGLTTTRHRQTNRVVGWLVELEGGASAWIRRGTRVARAVR